MFTKQNKIKSLQASYVYKTKQVYKHVMFIKQNIYIQVMFTKQNKTKGLQTRYVYKTKN